MPDIAEDLRWMFTEGAAYADDDAWHAAATRLRHENPIVRVEREGWPSVWAIMKHADVMAIERRHDVFLSTPRSCSSLTRSSTPTPRQEP